MNALRFLTVTTLLFTSLSVFGQATTETFKVYGNCHSCEKHIETAAKQAGADKADWNMDTKMITVSYDSTKTSDDAIQKKIASVGYDTEKYKGDDAAYNKLDHCCQYERKK